MGQTLRQDPNSVQNVEPSKNEKIKSLEKRVKEEVLKKRSNVLDNVIFDYDNIDDNPNNVMEAAPPSPLLKLKIRYTTQYLNWRLSILKRDNFTCKICHASVTLFSSRYVAYLVIDIFWIFI